MNTAQEWEERYRRPGYWAGTEPAAFLVQAMPFLPRGRVLDIAMGEGRNAVYLAAHGWRVVGIDRSAAALAKAEELAAAAGNVPTRRGPLDDHAPREPGVLLVEADLEDCQLPPAVFDVAICFNYLQRGLFPSIERALRPGGLLLYQTYTVDQLEYREGPRSPEFLLRRDELRVAFPRLATLFYGESNAGKGIATLLARRPVH